MPLSSILGSRLALNILSIINKNKEIKHSQSPPSVFSNRSPKLLHIQIRQEQRNETFFTSAEYSWQSYLFLPVHRGISFMDGKTIETHSPVIIFCDQHVTLRAPHRHQLRSPIISTMSFTPISVSLVPSDTPKNIAISHRPYIVNATAKTDPGLAPHCAPHRMPHIGYAYASTSVRVLTYVL